MDKLTHRISFGMLRQMLTAGIIATLDHAIEYLLYARHDKDKSTGDAIALINRAQDCVKNCARRRN